MATEVLPTDISALIAKRKNLFDHLQWLIDQFNFETPRNQLEYHELITVKEEIDTLRHAYVNIKDSLDEGDPNGDKTIHYEISKNFINITSRIKANLAAFEEANRVLVEPALVHAPTPRPIQFSQGFKLPEIPLPRFNGDFENWLNFRSAFTSIIVDNDSVDNSAKFQYLKQVLSGEALNRIANAPPGDFTLAWNLLKTRYDNPILIADRHVSAILNPPQLNSKSAQSWRSLIDHQKTNIFALEALDLGIDVKDLLFMYVTVSRFDIATLRDWERYNSTMDDVSIDNLWNFMESQHKVSQAVSLNLNHSAQVNPRANQQQPSRSAALSFNSNNRSIGTSNSSFNNSRSTATPNSVFQRPNACLYCNNSAHSVFTCSQLSNLQPQARVDAVRKKHLCFNCLRPFSTGHQCFGACKQCGKAHHSILHGASFQFTSSGSKATANANSVQLRNTTISSNSSRSAHLHSCSCGSQPAVNLRTSPLASSSVVASTSEQSLNSTVESSARSPIPAAGQVVSNSSHTYDGNKNSTVSIMPTAEVVVYDKVGQPILCRTLLDTGSDTCFISKHLASRLSLVSTCHNNTIHTVSGINTAPMYSTSVEVFSSDRTWSRKVSCIIADKITPSLPPVGIDISKLSLPTHIQLADPAFHLSQGIDLLLSVSVYASILTFGQIQISSDCILQGTKLGWVVWGAVLSTHSSQIEPSVHSNFISTCEISNQMEKFWKLEEVLPKDNLTAEHRKIEQHYLANVERASDGRFSVALPKKESFHTLGQSRFQALNRFHSLEKRLAANPELKEQYTAFMDEYQSLGHMSPVSPSTWKEISSNVIISQPKISLVTCSTTSLFSDLSSKISSYHKLVRIAAYILRFIHNLKHCREPASQQSVELSVQEIQAAELRIIQDIQSDVFADDLKSLRQGKELPSNSSIKSLSPFIHTDNLLRVGGRLREADIPFDYKHQILLPAKHRFTRALIVSFHRRLQHAGVQVTMASIRQRFWIPSTRRIIKSVIKGCKMCFRFSTFRSEQIMGHLPAVRVQPDFPFYNCGVDYAGPLSIRLGGSKSRNFSKAYLALFICMVTRAVHVEVVSELSTKAFIAALIRFSARRGIPFAIHSDNATTFVGAHNELNELHAFLSDSAIQSEIHNFAAVFNIGWHFIPPRAPHFGGLWENAVKNFKRIFRVVTLNKILNFEELSTLSAQIEAILNSRPLVPLSEDPQDLAYLSPGHFLVGRPLTALPFHTPTTTHIDHRSRWRQLALITQELWDRWSAEFLVTLQRKSKWSSESENLQIGAVVILKDTGTSPSVWKLARITAVHPGKDNKVRVVTVRTASGTFKRAISSIAPLPLDEEFSD
ncbi:uncharacterized protein LOC111054561 [Nilaparvata lugens]|uniref:uncharacterized protein LOC111054561 n=1 Tax=Nilaparvata lugens TaxID=108931 RepID=UPI00193DA01C|nr:uncharacterized protein LOC111054561 [Nilaparvata lugens]